MEQQKKYWFCDFCEIQILKVSKSRHEKTKKHEQNLTRQTEPTHQVVEEVVVPIVEEKVVIEEIVFPIVEEVEEYKSPRSQDRLECFERNKYWINDPKWKKGKGAFMRQNIIWFLRVFSTKSNFRDEYHEYQCIGKFGRGFWSQEHIQSFPPDIQKILVEDCARSYGLFDY